jgi:uncharacterized protein YegP (UPF0339 family)
MANVTKTEIEFYSPRQGEFRWRIKGLGRILAYSSAFHSEAELKEAFEVVKSELAKQGQIETAEISQEISDISSTAKQTLELTRRLALLAEDKAFLRPEFVESSPGIRTFGKRVGQILDDLLKSKGCKGVEICIMGYFDQANVDRLKEILARGGMVRIISPAGQLERGGDRRNLDALRRMEKNGADVRIHPMLHARIFYVSTDEQPLGVIVGSGDLKADCMGELDLTLDCTPITLK